MNKKYVLIAIPAVGYSDWFEYLPKIQNGNYFIFDNGNDSRLKLFCLEHEYLYTYSDSKLSRSESWSQCFAKAAEQDFEWVKPLFIGDSINPVFISELAEFENSDFVIFRYLIREFNKLRLSRVIRDSGNAKLNTYLNGPWMGSPLAIAIKSQRILEKLNPNKQIYSEWTADFELLLPILLENNYSISDKIIGTFEANSRNFYFKQRFALKSFKEELYWMNLFSKEIHPTLRQRKSHFIRVLQLLFRKIPLFSYIFNLTRIKESNF